MWQECAAASPQSENERAQGSYHVFESLATQMNFSIVHNTQELSSIIRRSASPSKKQQQKKKNRR